MPSSITLKALGLNLQPNQLDVQPGSLTVANNVVIRRDNVVESRRGYKIYGNSLGSTSDRAKQLMTYKGRILRHFSNQLEFDSDGNGKFLAFAGTYLEPQTGRRIRFIESNGNFYFTTANGIERISAKTAADFTTAAGFIQPAGGIKALDLTARLSPNPSGFLPPDSAVAYRVLWNTTDANGNLIQGTPSSRVVVVNSLGSNQLVGFNQLLTTLTNIANNTVAPSLISQTDYFTLLGLNANSSPSNLRTNLITLVQKLDKNILYADTASLAPLQIKNLDINSGIATINFNSGVPSNYLQAASLINLTGFATTTGTVNGPQIVTSTFPSFSTTGNTQTGLVQKTQITTVADNNGSLGGAFFFINSSNDQFKYYVWYKVSGIGSDPNIAGKIGVQVNITTNDTANTVASTTSNALGALVSSFTSSFSTNVILVTNISVGACTAATIQTSGFSINTSLSPAQTGTNGNIISGLGSTTGINIGSIVSDLSGAIPLNSYVISIGIGSITISNSVTTTVVGDTLNFTAGLNFNTTATGPITQFAPTIYSNKYESIFQPGVPSTPATNAQLVALQTFIQTIINTLQAEPSTGTPPTISTASQTQFVSNLNIVTNANVILDFTVPQGITTNYFYQIYRSDIVSATDIISVTDIAPNDELKLVYEAYATTANIAAGFIEVLDITPQQFAGAFLYTDETNGQGILQANDIPPASLDIATFKNYVFYANTRTRERQLINLLGVSNMIADALVGNLPTFTISDGVTTNTYTFVIGVAQSINITTVADIAGSLAGKYFTFNTVNNQKQYYVWYKVSGVGTDPLIAGRTGIEVDLINNDSANIVASKTNTNISSFLPYFSSTVLTNVISITNAGEGTAAAPNAGTSGFTVVIANLGAGENASLHQILLSKVVSPAQAVTNTALSMVRVINSNPNEIINAYYLSTELSVPGKMLFEERTLSANPFYIIGNNAHTGQSFSPDISPTINISSIAIGNPTIITTSTPHGLVNQNKIEITNSNSTPSIDGVYTITYINTTQFSIPINVTVAGTRGALINTSIAVTSDNEILPNRIYYSKLLQPDAVPLVNTIDVGAKDKAILRIFALRDSLFVYKEDGLYRISGENAPFNLALFDVSCILLAPDSLDVSNNIIYGWTTQGITVTSEAGVNIISRPIDTQILRLATNQYGNFKSATWGIGYESDNSYTVYTVQNLNDVYAQIGYRFSTLTNTWTNFTKTATCGVINSTDDKQYLGAGDINDIEQERKNFERQDYADREYIKQLELNNYFGNQLQFTDLSNLAVGDVIVQDQLVTRFLFNELLIKLDHDTFLSPHTYVLNNTMGPGVNSRTQLDVLLTQIANDPGRLAQPSATPSTSYLALQSNNTLYTITNISASDPTVITTSIPHNLQNGRFITITGSNSVPSIDGTYQMTVLTGTTFTIPFKVTQMGSIGTLTVVNDNFSDIEASYNQMITLLNTDLGVAFNNYNPIINDTIQEALVTDINIFTKKITINVVLDFLVGPITIYHSIDSLIEWSPQVFGDPLSMKHVRQAQLLFDNQAFSNATLSFASDLLPSFNAVPIVGTGNGIFGYTGIPGRVNNVPGPIGFGYGFFGGASHSVPFRTLIPAQNQRCTFLRVRFEHTAAREMYAIYGLTLVPNDQAKSERAYR